MRIEWTDGRTDVRTDRRGEDRCKKRLNKQLSKWEHRPRWALHYVSSSNQCSDCRN